jgi:thiol-disulfide isomerase/thioredoxin
MTMKRPSITALFVIVGLLLAAVAFSRVFFRAHTGGSATQTTFSKEFSLVLTDYSGKDVHLYDFRRKVLIAYAWASWCPYCGAELQNLAQMKKTYGDNLEVIAINRAEPLATAKAYTDKLQGTDNLVFLIDPTDSFFKNIGGYAMPETVFIDSDGTITFHQRGPLKIAELEQKVKDLLK